jgi:signal transduction histidine kinase/EAL domain-containing protein (putative c-di-GMP-specific phosphodiesterase class I)/HPt (histidine-containing phosphotransfer) domain-containing protein/ActR/RegA family two-component response regulator
MVKIRRSKKLTEGDPAPVLRRTSILVRLQVLVLGSVLFVTVPVAGLFAWQEASRHATARWITMKTAADVLATSASRAAEQRHAGDAFGAIAAVSRTPGVVYASVRLPDGRVLAETGSGAILRSDVRLNTRDQAPDLRALLTTQHVEVTADIRRGAGVIGTVSIVHRAGGFLQDLLGALAGVFGLALVALVGALIVTRRVQAAMTRPLLDLTGSVAAITASGDFKTRVAGSSDDEVGDLVNGFNAMLDAIDARDARIDAQVKGLEAEVAARTADYVSARDAAESANEAKSAFLATMSHEIRTPMNGVLVTAELLEGEDLPSKARRHVHTIVRSGRTLLAVINDILDFSKIEAGKMDVEILPVDLLDLVDDTIGLFAARAREKQVELVALANPAAPRLAMADPVRLGQVVTNLVSNALKFTQTGYVLVRIEPDTLPGHGRIVVVDSGIGIAADKLGTIFTAFSQEDQSTTRKFGGTGLGLSIARKLVEAMGGAIGVTSEQGKGSRFHVRIPSQRGSVTCAPQAGGTVSLKRVHLAVTGPAEGHGLEQRFLAAGFQIVAPDRADVCIADLAGRERLTGIEAAKLVLMADPDDTVADQWVRQGRAAGVLLRPVRHRDLDGLIAAVQEGSPPATALQAHATGGSASVSTCWPEARVLVADDSEVNREVALEALSRFGITAATAVDGRDALDQMGAQTFDLVLMDGSMPELDGFEATRLQREREAATGDARVAVVALTAHVVGSGADAWRAAGMDGILHKPFTLEQLGLILANHLDPALARPAEAVDTSAPVVAPTGAMTSAPGGDDAELFDMTVTGPLLAGLTSGRAEFVARVTGLYREHGPQAAADVTSAFEAGDADGVARAAHALKSMSLNLGARAVAASAAGIEAAVRQHGVMPEAGTVNRIGETLTRTLEALDRLMAGSPAAAPPASRAVTVSEAIDDGDAALARDLQRAITLGELSVLYQPLYDRGGETIVSCEALVRWQRPGHPPIGPDRFIPLAEHAGLIHGLGAEVRRLVFADMPRLGSLPVAVNVSPVELASTGFFEGLASQIALCRIDTGRLVIEVTETAFLGEPERVRELFDRLRATGIKLALDDFGVGYSSMTALRRFPFDKIKIDREFVRALDGERHEAMEALAIIQAITGIGRAMGREVVAEGVETASQHAKLRASGVHAMQGWLFSKAVSLEQLETMLHDGWKVAAG